MVKKRRNAAYLRYESGARTPSLQTLSIIANVLDTSVEYLTGQSDNFQSISYTLSKEDDPGLFEMISICKNSNDDMTRRLVSYAEKLLLNKK